MLQQCRFPERIALVFHGFQEIARKRVKIIIVRGYLFVAAGRSARIKVNDKNKWRLPEERAECAWKSARRSWGAVATALRTRRAYASGLKRAFKGGTL